VRVDRKQPPVVASTVVDIDFVCQHVLMVVASRKVLLARLVKATERLTAIETERDRAVAAAMAGGCSWVEIGAGLGMSAQGAHRRFRDLRVDEDGFVWREPRLPL
jgi:hypothetical protein